MENLLIENKNVIMLKIEKTSCYCTECGEIIPVDNAENYDGESYCEYCFNDKFTTCYECGEIIPIDNAENYDGDPYCEDCFNDKFTTCYECGEITLNDYASYYDGESYCENCFNDNFTTCEACGEAIPNDYIMYSERNDAYYCENCFDNNNGSDLIHEYSYTPKFQKNRVNKENSVLLGIELEIECGNNDSNDIAESIQNYLENNNISDNFYMKSDGSLNNGIEIVSHPSSLRYHKKYNYKDFLKYLQKIGSTSYKTGSCGLHVHIDRENLSNYDINKIAVFFDNAKNQIKKFSQRHGKDSYCKHNNYNLSNIKNKNNYANGNRYNELNLNRNTLEIRIARGTLNYERFSSWIQFCDSVVYFVKNYSVLSLSWDNYMIYLKDSNRYQKLITYLNVKVNENVLRLENATIEN